MRWVATSVLRMLWWCATTRIVRGCIVTIILGSAFLFETRTPAHWLALAMYYESRDEPLRGRLAVANVVLNRVDDARWPSTVREVVSDGRERGALCDFSFICDGFPENPWAHDTRFWGKWISIRIEAYAIYALYTLGMRADNTFGAVYYKRADVHSPWFSRELRAGRMEKVPGDFGAHEFFR